MMMIDLMMVVAAAVVGTVMVGVWAMEEAMVAGPDEEDVVEDWYPIVSLS